MILLQDNKFNFGKYKNKDINEVYKENSAYIRWCLDNVKGFKEVLPEEIYNKIIKKSKSEGRYLGSRASGWLISWLN